VSFHPEDGTEKLLCDAQHNGSTQNTFLQNNNLKLTGACAEYPMMFQLA